MADPITFDESLNIRDILEKDPSTWTSTEAVLVLSSALMFYHIMAPAMEARENAGRALGALCGTVAVYAAPRIDHEVLMPWDEAKDLLKAALRDTRYE